VQLFESKDTAGRAGEIVGAVLAGAIVLFLIGAVVVTIAKL
jgi:hypothetical protein